MKTATKSTLGFGKVVHITVDNAGVAFCGTKPGSMSRWVATPEKAVTCPCCAERVLRLAKKHN